MQDIWVTKDKPILYDKWINYNGRIYSINRSGAGYSNGKPYRTFERRMRKLERKLKKITEIVTVCKYDG